MRSLRCDCADAAAGVCALGTWRVLAYVRFMRRISTLIMFLGWLVYGVMPALAACPMCDSSATIRAVIETTTAATHMRHMAAMSDDESMTLHAADRDQNPCKNGMAHLPSCAICLIVPPAIAIGDAKVLAFSYPAPESMRPLPDSVPAPTAPPPRLL
ncbi:MULTISPECIES: hypothetical protein [unclassified Sinorhizobium]|uniref:hypothetical protein n=1 Tax=unclassified Sinorhizobium TaxID=2613772 RepID=UPI00352377A8